MLLQWYNQAKYMTDVNWAVLLGAIVVTKAAWERIPPTSGRRSARPPGRGRKLRAQTREAAARDVEAMTERGLTVVHVDAATRRSGARRRRPPTRGCAARSCRRRRSTRR